MGLIAEKCILPGLSSYSSRSCCPLLPTWDFYYPFMITFNFFSSVFKNLYKKTFSSVKPVPKFAIEDKKEVIMP